MFNLLIVGAGLGTRVSNITFQVIPKFLINIDEHSGLYHMLSYWSNFTNDVYLVIHPIYQDVTDFYIEQFFPNLNVTYVFYEESDGTAYTIKSVLTKCQDKNLLKHNETLITWCDIYPDNTVFIPFKQIIENEEGYYNHDIILFTYGKECRYNWDEDNKEINNVGSTGGNIIGLYFFKDYRIILNSEIEVEKGRDIVEYLTSFVNREKITNIELMKMNDFGDENKIMELRRNKKRDIQCRHFNEIKINNNNFMKRGINKQGQEIIKKEIQWYNFLLNHRYSNDFVFPIPQIRILRNDYFIMEYLSNHLPLYVYLNEMRIRGNILDNVLERIWNEMRSFHSIEKRNVDTTSYFWNIKYEISDKIIERMNEIKPLIEKYKDIKLVNGLRIQPFENIMIRAKTIIIDYYMEKVKKNKKAEYSFIHGDPNFSNILVHPQSLSIKFIDPRGYFGKSLLFGIPEYDEAKFLYGIFGYDNFNFDPNFQPTFLNLNQNENEEKEIIFEIDNYINSISNEWLNNKFNIVHYAFLTIIWIGLAQYNKNNYWKCVCSYLYGLYIGTKYLF